MCSSVESLKVQFFYCIGIPMFLFRTLDLYLLYSKKHNNLFDYVLNVEHSTSYDCNRHNNSPHHIIKPSLTWTLKFQMHSMFAYNNGRCSIFILTIIWERDGLYICRKICTTRMDFLVMHAKNLPWYRTNHSID